MSKQAQTNDAPDPERKTKTADIMRYEPGITKRQAQYRIRTLKAKHGIPVDMALPMRYVLAHYSGGKAPIDPPATKST